MTLSRPPSLRETRRWPNERDAHLSTIVTTATTLPFLSAG
jgi:hypothetical protein